MWPGTGGARIAGAKDPRAKSDIFVAKIVEILHFCPDRPSFQAAYERKSMRKAYRSGLLPLALVILAGAWGLPLGAAPAPARTHDITIDDYFTEAFVNGCALSPDGHWVAYTEMRWEPPAEDRNTDLWLVNTQSSEVRRLTFDPASDHDPAWSADSRWIYFLAKRGKSGDDAPYNQQTQVWRIAPDGDFEQAVTRLKDGVEAFALGRSGKTLYYVVSHENQEDEWKDLRAEFSDLTYGRGVDNFSQVWALDLSSWREEKLIDDQRVINELAVSPDETQIAMITRPREASITNEGFSRVDVYNAVTKQVTALDDSLYRKAAPSPYGWLDGVAWSADGKALAFAESFDGYPSEILVAHFTPAGVRMHRLARPGEFSLADTPVFHWLGNSHDLLFVAEQKARDRIAVIENVQPASQGAFRIVTPGDVVADYFDVTPDGKELAVSLADVTHPDDIYAKTLAAKGEPRRLTRINPQIDTWKLPQIQIVSWIGAKGDTVEGILELPYDYKPGTKLPMHVALHGGPTDADRLYFEYWIYGRGLWPSLGWAVFAPNYRGSTGYGDKFLTDLIGHENDIEVEDILKGVDAMVERGYADPEKLALSGWSNGGFLTDAIITHTDRFKAASTGAGVLDMAIQWGTEDTPGHVVNFTRGLPWSAPDAYRKASPLYNLDKVKTPTLIHVGADDERVPPAHSQALFRALDFYLHVPTELVIYPGQGHGLTKYASRKAKLEWDKAWFDKYVLQRPVNEPVKPVQ
jgi:dipeptidyl aminopeptidase/acylaminoacyl peptidase